MLLPFQFLIGCLSAVRLVVAIDNSFFTSVDIRDVTTGYRHILDPEHWFMIEAELFVCAGQDKDVFLSIPEDFTSIAETPFNLLHKSQAVGRVVAQDNIVKVSFPNPPSKNITASFKIVAKLSKDALVSIGEPQVVEYVFYSSQGESFKEWLNYVGKSMDEVTVNSGHYEHNRTTWYTVDVPITQLDEPVIIFSEPRTDAYTKIHTDKTRCELVTSVDAFNEATEWVPVGPLEDLSSENAIDMTFDKNLDGFYLRIVYFAERLDRAASSGQVNFQKRLSGEIDSETEAGESADNF